MKKIVIILLALLLPVAAFPCFDTFLFLNRSSMVYPSGMFAFDVLGEYTMNRMDAPGNDTLLMNLNAFYGVTKDLSVQVTLGSDEKERNMVKMDVMAVRGVLNLMRNVSGGFNMDIILEHHTSIVTAGATTEVSLPGILHLSNFTFVVHPVAGYTYEERAFEFSVHGGAFYRFGDSALIGLGSEYAGGEVAASLFVGGKLGPNIFIQNEFIKGLANSKDFAVAATLKFLIF